MRTRLSALVVLALAAPAAAQDLDQTEQTEQLQVEPEPEQIVAPPPDEEIATEEQPPPPPIDPSPTCAGRARQAAADSVVRIRSGGRWGAGFFYHSRRHVVSAFSLISLGQSITVVTRDGTEHSARVLASDQEFDLVVLELEADAGSPLGPAPEGSAMIGAPAIAIGHPHSGTAALLGDNGDGLLRWSVSTGTIGGVNELGLQADVALHGEGHTGAPLVDCEGRVLGMISGAGMLSSDLGLVLRPGRIDRVIRQAGEPGEFLGDLRLRFGLGGVLSIDEEGRATAGIYLLLGAVLFDRASWMNRVGILWGGIDGEMDDELSVSRQLVRIESLLGYRIFLDIGGFTTLYIVPSVGLVVNNDHREVRTVRVEEMCTPDADTSCIDIARTSTDTWNVRPAIGVSFLFGGTVDIGYTLEIHPEDPVETFHAVNLGLVF
jgi:S1-C subfamily serine protease